MGSVRRRRSDDRFEPSPSPPRECPDREVGLPAQSTVSKVNIQFGSVPDKLKAGVNVLPVVNWATPCDREQDVPRMIQADDVTKSLGECVHSIAIKEIHPSHVMTDVDDRDDEPNARDYPDVVRLEANSGKTGMKALHKGQVCGKQRSNPSVSQPNAVMDNSWKKSKDFYSIRYNMAFNYPSNQSLLSYDDAARTSRPQTSTLSCKPGNRLSVGATEKPSKLPVPSRSLCTLSPAVSARSRVDGSRARTGDGRHGIRPGTRTQETKYKQNGAGERPGEALWIKTDSIAVADGGSAFTSSSALSDSGVNIMPRAFKVVVQEGHSACDQSPREPATDVQKTQSSGCNARTKRTFTSSARREDQAVVGAFHRKPADAYLSGKRLSLNKCARATEHSAQLSFMLFDSGSYKGDVCHPVHERGLGQDRGAPQNAHRLPASTGSSVPPSTSPQPVKWSTSLLSRSWKTAESPKPPGGVLKCVPCDAGLEVVSETLAEAKNDARPPTRERRRVRSLQSCSHQNCRRQGGAASVLHFRAKSVTLPLHGLFQERPYNTTMMSNYGRKKFLIPSSSMPLVEKEVNVPARPMSEFAEAQLKKIAALKESQKNRPKKAPPAVSTANKGMSMFDEIRGLMQKSKFQSKEADNKIIKIPDER